MDRKRWQQIDSVLQAALEIEPAERLRFVENKCDGDDDLAREVMSYLELHDDAEDFIEQPAISQLSDPIFSSDLKDVRIGNYRLTREIGRGGMGAVYLATRDDLQFRQTVALKVMKRGMDTDEILDRFRQERQILADLNHPNIARLIDGGTTDDGLPYFAMEFVDGIPIDKFFEAGETNIEKQLEIFRAVCSAIQYAHQRLVVHRDIKPSNILVAVDGVPKLLDFGIAKLLTVDSTNTTTKFRALTPKYASPEQIAGGAITTATDVYSLGVVLREILSGTAKKTNGDLPSDLSAILQTATREEPERRYTSVQQLSEDIERFSRGLPVTAQKDSFRYRSEKFIRRNKLGVAAGAGVAVSLIGGIAATLRQSRIAARQRDRARAESKRAITAARKAEQINAFLRDMLRAADPRVQGRDVTVAAMLDVAARQLDRDLADQPEIYADLQTTLGTTYLALGFLEKAEPHLKSALEIRTRVFGRRSGEHAESLSVLGRLLQTKGELSAAEPLFHEALNIFRRYGEDDLDVASALNDLGGLMLAKGELNVAARCHREEIDIRRETLGLIHPDVARSLCDLAVVYGTMGRWEDSERLHRESLDIVREVYGGEHPDVALAMTTLASAVDKRDPTEAAELFSGALRMRRKVLGDTHPDTAWTLYNYAYFLTDNRRFDEAKNYCDEVLSMRGSALPESHPMIHSTLQVLGRVFMAEGRLATAESAFRESLELRRDLLSPRHWLVAMACGWLAECLSHQGRSTDADALFDQSFNILDDWFAPGHEKYQQILQKADAHRQSRR